MKRNLPLVALVLATIAGTATADTGLAGDISVERTPFVSTLARDEVRASVSGDHSAIAAMHAEDSGSSSLQFTSTLDRAEVVAGYIAHRDEVAAMHGEDSGSALLASTRRGAAPMQLAIH